MVLDIPKNMQFSANVNTLIPVLGIHTAGKTSIIRYLSDLGAITENELAEEVRLKHNMGAAAEGSLEFDSLVQKAEIERDCKRQWTNSKLIFVEGWHIMTYAYLLTRNASSDILYPYRKYIKTQQDTTKICCIFLCSDAENVDKRNSRIHKDDKNTNYLDFYRRLNYNIIHALSCLEIPYVSVNANRSFECVKNDVIQFCKSEGLLSINGAGKTKLGY